MSYVDGLIDRDRDIIHVVERVNGVRRYLEYPAHHTLYYPSPKGKYTSIFGDSLERVVCNSGRKFAAEKKLHHRKGLFESDTNPVFRCLADNYLDAEPPTLNVALFDIETDFNREIGYAPPDDPFNAITAISVHMSWMKQTVCLVIKPSSMTEEDAQAIVDRFDNAILCESEEAMLTSFLELIDDADILTGWNSEGFDIPYTVNRVSRVLSKSHTRQFCLWDKFPKQKEVVKFGKETQTYDLIGRIHLDYLELYRKYTYHEMHSYSLDAICEYELGDQKVEYEGTLDQLYHNDFFKFIQYSIQDVDLMVRLDEKLQFIDLANLIAHSNTVLLPTTMGSVAQIDQAIINEAHSQGLIVPDKKRGEKPIAAAGAYVATPIKGVHRDIASIDLNSLYPSILRACNMSTETVVGQIKQVHTRKMLEDHDLNVPKAWEGRFACIEYEMVMEKNTTSLLTLEFVDGTAHTLSGAEIYELVFESDQPWILTANGTLFTHEKKGIVPQLLETWYAERKILQTKARDARDEGGDKFAYWDKRQLVKKILLNSLYGALLNPGSRFFDERLGQSTTLTGRCIARHMAASLNEVITGEYDHKGKSIVYGDTDSTYFSAYPILKDQIEDGSINWDNDTMIAYYDAVCGEVDTTFAKFMMDTFHTTHELGVIIAAAREVVATSGLFVIKKRYALMVIDNEGKREDVDGKPGKIKAMGLDLKRSDTPKFMQEFLKEILGMVLTGVEESIVIDRIVTFRSEFRAMDSWQKGTPKRVNNLTNHTKKYNKIGKCGVGHAMAAINWNRLKQINDDAYSMDITDGMKTIVCKLKKNPMGMTSIGYPTDAKRIPDWFKELPFDDGLMEETIITKKIENLIGVLKWDLQSAAANNTFSDLFDF